MYKIILINEFLHEPIWIYDQNKKIRLKYALISNDPVLQSLNLFELKVARSANKEDKLLNEAINQVISKQYGLNTEPGKLFRFAVVFNLEKRLFTLGEQIKD